MGGSGTLNNRSNLRSLSIFQLTDKHVVGDCSQAGAHRRRSGGRGGGRQRTQVTHFEIAALKKHSRRVITTD